MSGATSACKAAHTQLTALRYVEERPGGPTFSFFPLDRLRNHLTRTRVEEILQCGCIQCNGDHEYFEQPLNPLQSVSLIIGEDGTPRTTSNTAFSLFSLLIYLGHPIFIVGFVHMDRNDVSLELFPEMFARDNLKAYTGSFATDRPVEFREFAFQFTQSMPQFAVRHITHNRFSRYPPNTILPFINEKEIGKRYDEETGYWTNIGANGRVFSFEIHDEYRNFKHARRVTKFARKIVERTMFIAWLEKSNLEHTQIYNDKHIVTLIKAYSLGGVMNLIFPLAKTNLEELLTDSRHNYTASRAVQLESCDAWKQLLGISKALSKIAGVPSEVSSPSSGRDSNSPQWFGFHFDLKPANILIEEDDTWVITDFGQATFTYSTSATPRVAGGGTDAYAPPEIDNMKEQFSRRYDVWSLGCIFLEVTAFLVLGYAGLKGCDEYEGLSQARKETDGCSNHFSDSRFFYRSQDTGECRVKKAIIGFMGFLKTKVADQSQQTQQFLAEILQLIEKMLQVEVEKRLDIGDVIRLLDEIIMRATSKDNDGVPLQIGPAPNEISIGDPELGMVELWHLSDDKQWQRASLQVFEDPNANLRFTSLATGSRTVTKQYMRRNRDVLLPHYAFFDREKVPGHVPWISFANTDASDIPGAVYGFSSAIDVHTVQSLLTYQSFEISFPLLGVRVKKYTKISQKAWTGITKVFGPKNGARDTIEEALIEGRDLGLANVQLWTEQEDRAAMKKKGRQSLSAGSGEGKRKPRIFNHQNEDQPIYPRRVVIYLRKYGCILTVRTNVNWRARLVDGEKKIHFKPTDPERDPRFVVSLLRSDLPDHYTGLPLCPKVLGKMEEQSRFEADFCELVFTNNDDSVRFNYKYRELKRKWQEEKEQVESQQGYKPGFGPPNPNIEPGLSCKSKRKSEPTFARQTFAQPPFSQATFSPPTSPQPIASQSSFSQPTFAQSNGVYEHYAPVPQAAPSTPMWPPSDRVLGGEGRQRVDVPQVQLNDQPLRSRTSSFPPLSGPRAPIQEHRPPARPNIAAHRGGGRGRPPSAFANGAAKKSRGTGKDQEGKRKTLS